MYRKLPQNCKKIALQFFATEDDTDNNPAGRESLAPLALRRLRSIDDEVRGGLMVIAWLGHGN